MSKLIAVLVASLFATVAVAQQNTPGIPPTQPAAGTSASAGAGKTPAATDAPVSDKKAARTAKAKARKAKRDAKVGDKPID